MMTNISLHTIWRTAQSCYAWWQEGLFSLLPSVVRERFPESRHLPYIEIANLQDRDTVLPQRIFLRLPADQVLSKTLTLPLAAERDLINSMALQLPQLTPYMPEQACFDAMIINRDVKTSQLGVLLVVAPLQTVHSALTAAENRGVEIERLSAIDDAIDLTPKQRGRGIKAHLLRLTLALIGLALFAAAFTVPLHQLQNANGALLQELNSVKSQAEDVLIVQDELDAMLTNSTFLINHKNAMPATSEIIAEITSLLPETAWLIELHQTGANIRLIGFAHEATSLLTIFENAPDFVEARFNSPVTLSADRSNERFDITFTYSQKAGK